MKDSLVVSESIDGVVRRLEATQVYVGNDKRKEMLEVAKKDAMRLNELVDYVYFLDNVSRMLIELSMPMKVNNQSSRQMISGLLLSLKKEKEKLSKSVGKNIDGATMMDDELYHVYKEQVGKSSDLVDNAIVAYYQNNKRTISSLIPAKYETVFEKASWLVKHNGGNLHINGIGSEGKGNVDDYEVRTGAYVEKKGKQVLESIKFDNIVDACIFLEQNMLRAKVLNSDEYSFDMSKINKSINKNLEYHLKQCDAQFLYPDSKVQKLVNELKEDIKMESLYKKSFVLLDLSLKVILSELKFIDYKTEQQLINIENQIKSEMSMLEKYLLELREKITNKEKKLREMIEKYKEDETQNQNEKVEQKENVVSDEKVIKNSFEKEDNTSNKLNVNTNNLENSKQETISLEQKELYEKYKKYRSVIDLIANKEHDIEKFKLEVVEQMRFLGLGMTYEEIMDNLNEMREQLEFTHVVKDVFLQARLVFEGDVDAMNMEQDNGLTAYENMINYKMEELSQSEEITPELKSELQYYIDKHYKLANEMRFVYLNKAQYEEEDYNMISDSARYRNYLNTYMLEEFELKNAFGKQRASL